MNKGVFSQGFTGQLGEVLGELFGDEFPAGALPDPTAVLADLNIGGPVGGGPSFDLPADVFDFGPSGVARALFEGPADGSAEAGSLVLMSAVSTDADPMFGKPDGVGGGGGGGKPGGGGGGGGGGKGGGKPDKGGGGGDGGVDPPPDGLAATYTSGDPLVGDGAEYNIVVEFYGAWDDALMHAFGAAADFLSSIILGDLADDSLAWRTFEDPAVDGYITVDDILIEAYLPSIDGVGSVLGQAGPYTFRGWSDPTTVVGLMEFDSADAQNLATQGSWDAVVLHEMMHVLGFGTLWEFSGVTDPFGRFYTGSAGLAEYTAETGSSTLQIETDGGPGTAGGHWDEVAYGDELMTGYLSGTPYLADWTIMSLNDIGYDTVDLSGATGANALSDGIDLEGAALVNDFVIVDDTLIV